jgi:hypothetical protein
MDVAIYHCSIGTDNDDIAHTSLRVQLWLVAFLTSCLSFSHQVFQQRRGFDAPMPSLFVYLFLKLDNSSQRAVHTQSTHNSRLVALLLSERTIFWLYLSLNSTPEHVISIPWNSNIFHWFIDWFIIFTAEKYFLSWTESWVNLGTRTATQSDGPLPPSTIQLVLPFA